MTTLQLHFVEDVPAEIPAAPALFSAITIRRVPRPSTLFASCVSHGLALVLVALLSHLGAFDDERIDWSPYRVEMIRLRLPDPIYFSGSEPPKTSAPLRAARAADRKPGGLAAKSGSPVPPGIELPNARKAATRAEIIVQPEFRPGVEQPKTALPPLAFWARQGAHSPSPAPRRPLLTPGRTEAPSPPPKLASPPVVAIPNLEQAAGDVNVAAAPASSKTPSFPVPNSSTLPIRRRDAAESQPASFEAFAGQPANIIALAAEPRLARDVEIARGFENIPQFGPPGDAAAHAGSGAGRDMPNPGNGSSGANNEGTARGASQSGATAREPGHTANAESGKASVNASAPSSGSAGGVTPPRSIVSAPGSERVAADPAFKRVEHPANGSFDVVIMQTAARDDLPNVGGILSGNPVYTVYLPVGDKKDWLLKYCLPARGNPQSNPYQIKIEDATPITPPYPISTSIPDLLLVQPFSTSLVLHGVLTAAGAFRDVKGPDPATPLAEQIIALVSEWRFRPALRNRRPIDIEILLVIPPRG